MYEAPSMFWAVWQLVSPFIHPDTKAKVVFVSSKSAIKEFQQTIDGSVTTSMHLTYTLVWESFLTLELLTSSTNMS